MTPEIAKAVHRTAIGSAVLGAILSPIPLVDELVLFPVYGWLTARIGSAHGLAYAAVPWKPVLRTAFNGLLARAGLNLAVSYIPGVAAVANAATAGLLTELFGQYADEACADPAAAKAVGVREITDLLRKKAVSSRSTARTEPGSAA